MNLESRLDWSALLLRCTTGTLFLAHGFYLKLFVFGLDGTVGFFQSLGYPATLAYFVVAAETLGGLALILGLFTRWVSLGLIPILTGALLVHAGNSWLFNAPDGGWEYPVFWIVVMLVLALLGDGRYSLSRLLTTRSGGFEA
jgi:putative oxidoreductase